MHVPCLWKYSYYTSFRAIRDIALMQVFLWLFSMFIGSRTRRYSTLENAHFYQCIYLIFHYEVYSTQKLMRKFTVIVMWGCIFTRPSDSWKYIPHSCNILPYCTETSVIRWTPMHSWRKFIHTMLSVGTEYKSQQYKLLHVIIILYLSEVTISLSLWQLLHKTKQECWWYNTLAISIYQLLFVICDCDSWSINSLIGTLEFLMAVLVRIVDCPSKYFWLRINRSSGCNKYL